MLKNNLLLLSCIFILISCKKKDDETKSDVLFYNAPRTILYSDDFKDGNQSFKLDKKAYSEVGIGQTYLQNGIYYLGEEMPNHERDYIGFQCDDIDPGYLKIGCPEPLIAPAGYEKQFTYELSYIDTLFAYSEVIELNMNLEASESIALQIDYQKSGYTEIHVGNYKLMSLFSDDTFDDKTINISINHLTGSFIAFSDDMSVNAQFILIKEQEKKNHVKFIAERWVDMKNGVPYVNLAGLRIGKVEAYLYK